MNLYFDGMKSSLIDDESGIFLKRGKKNYSFCEEGIQINRYNLSDDDDNRGYSSGDYFTAFCDGVNSVTAVKVLTRNLVELLKSTLNKADTIICCGIGNPYMTADALGCKTVRKLASLRPENLKLLMPLVEGITGIPSIEILKTVTAKLRCDMVIAVDSLSTKNVERVGKSYQFTNSGIVPGGAIGSTLSVDANFLGIPVIAIGVPTVTRVKGDKEDYLLAPKEIDVIIDSIANNLAEVISRSVRVYI